jgi:hypothetical protein
VLFSDTYFHLYVARVLRERGLHVPARLPGIVLRHEHTYPPLYHLALAALPERWRMTAERATGALADCIMLLAAYVAVLVWMAGDPDAGVVALVVAFAFALAPGLLRIGSGPRAYNGSPRPVGQALFVLHALLAHAWVEEGHLGLLAGSALAAAGVVLGSKFSVQVLLFFSFAFSAFVSLLYLTPVSAGFGAALLFVPRRTLKTLVGHVQHSLFYARDLQRIFLYPHTRGFVAYVRNALGQTKAALVSRNPNTFLDWFFGERQALHLLVVAFAPCAAAPLLVAGKVLSAHEHFALIWVLAALACFAITSLRYFMFLGEGERYLEYAMLPALYLCASVLYRWQPGVLAAYLGFSAAAALYFQSAYRRFFSHLDEQAGASERIFATLAGRPSGCVMPVGSFHWQALYRSAFPVLSIGANIDARILPREEFLLVYGHYPYPSAQFDRILDTYGVRYIFSDKQHIAHYSQNILDSPDTFYRRARPLAAEGELVLYEVKA